MYTTTAATAFALTSFLTLTNAAVHTVSVGDGGLVFKPETLNPAVGDTVVFKLYPQHNVVSGSFSSPCQPSGGNGGNASFYSGPFSDTNNGAKKFVVNVTSTQPVYYYCAVQRHCQQGMVGGWNLPSSGNDIKAYASAAARVSSASTPSALAGGRLLDDSQLASVTASASQPSSSGNGRYVLPSVLTQIITCHRVQGLRIRIRS
ncbi:hypothetical protein DM02DRAFT_235717 [Periconia macrospinosa]|uniref:Blue (type 1) copper domain-containing protein n=1 Tax=Periconia macrospinosa TaxID=97972 RepID=A0A2V1EBJ9_9PLEO|nr:hypothetical protein DM02DRAFT_235717 [Periconia macrospinosa]